MMGITASKGPLKLHGKEITGFHNNLGVTGGLTLDG